MPKIFISYRREDSIGLTGRIYDRLGSHFGQESVFMDVDAIPFGVDFRQHLTEAVGACDVLLVVIGDQWLTIAQNGERRLDDPRDFVRIEIEVALQRGIPVIPLLLGKASMPREDELPAAMASLSFRNAAPIDPGRDFHTHMDRLIRGLEQLTEKASAAKARQEAERAEAERQRQELATSQRDGETKLAALVRDAMDRTRGKPTEVDTAAAKALVSRHQVSSERAKLIVREAKLQWAKDQPPKMEPKVGDIITNSIGMKFAWVPPGESRLGGGGGDFGTTLFTLERGVWCGIYPVTQSEWQHVMGNNPSHFKDQPSFPVESVSWNDVQKFLEKLNQRGGEYSYRLPTEQEWEYICRGGTPYHYQSRFHYYLATAKTDLTPNPTNDLANNQANFGNHLQKPNNVGSYLPNPLGIFDLHGNVWEWTSSPEGLARVIRGGSWRNDDYDCRASYRSTLGPEYFRNYVGFRLLAVPREQ